MTSARAHSPTSWSSSRRRCRRQSRRSRPRTRRARRCSRMAGARRTTVGPTSTTTWASSTRSLPRTSARSCGPLVALWPSRSPARAWCSAGRAAMASKRIASSSSVWQASTRWALACGPSGRRSRRPHAGTPSTPRACSPTSEGIPASRPCPARSPSAGTPPRTTPLRAESPSPTSTTRSGAAPRPSRRSPWLTRRPPRTPRRCLLGRPGTSRCVLSTAQAGRPRGPVRPRWTARSCRDSLPWSRSGASTMERW
mmetsp:Transcript_66810/g.172012  ORF Transcript_66810/g.172012 Transcript_66810/m.172012 type:complete len:254 (-) Transcript_66810:421-1182(-)